MADRKAFEERSALAEKTIQELTGRLAAMAGGVDVLQDNLRLVGEVAKLQASLAESEERERKLKYQISHLQKSLAAAEGGAEAAPAPKAAAASGPAKKSAQQIAEEEDEAAAKKQKNAYVLTAVKKSDTPTAAPTALFVDQTVYDDDAALGAKAPSLASLTFVRGEPVDVGKSHNVVVYFWGKYDTLGYNSLSHFTALQKKFKALRVVGVSIDPKIEDVRAFLEDPKYAEHASKIDFAVAWDAGKKIYNAYREVAGQVINLPHAFLVDKTGHIVWREVHRPLDSKCQFMNQVARFIEEKPLQKNGPKPVEEDEVADVPEDMSLF